MPEYERIPWIRLNLNLNTIVLLAGFGGTIATLATYYNNVTFQQAKLSDFRANAEADLRNLHAEVADLPQVRYRLAQVEGYIKASNDALGKLQDNTAVQIDGVKTEIHNLDTKVELSNQILRRLEANATTGSSALHSPRHLTEK